MLEGKEKREWPGISLIFCAVPVADNFRASTRQYSIGENMTKVDHMLKRDRLRKPYVFKEHILCAWAIG